MKRSECLEELAELIVGIPLEHPTKVAVDGVDGVGKSTLADELVEPIRRAGREVIRASVDGFHNPSRIRYERGAESPEGYFLDSFNYPMLKAALLDPMGAGGHRKLRTSVFDHRKDKEIQMPPRTAGPHDVLLLDGIFLLRPELEGYWDLTIWVEAPFEVSIERAIQRELHLPETSRMEPTALRHRFENRYLPGQGMYMDLCRPKERADVIVDNTDFSNPGLNYRKGCRGV